MVKRNTSRTERSYLKYTAVGIQFAVAISLFTLLGVWLDKKFESDPWWTLVGALTGIVGGMTSIIYRVGIRKNTDES